MAGEFQAAQRDVPDVIQGMRNANDTVDGRIIKDVQDKIVLVMPKATPYITLTSKIRKKRKATQFRYDVLTKDEYPRVVAAEGALDSDDTSLVLAAGHGDRVAVNYILQNLSTGEQVAVTAVSTDTLTIVRGIGGGAADIADGDLFLFLRQVFEDGSDIGIIKSAKETFDYNYTEIMRRSYGWTDRQINTDMYGGRDTMTEREFQAIEFKKDMELAMIFGKRHSRTESSGKLRTFTGGIDSQITTNRWDLNGALPTESAFIEMMEETMRYGEGGSENGSGEKWLLGSSRWMTVMNKWGGDRMEFRPGDKTLGMDFTKYTSPHGVLNMVKMPLLDRNHPDRAYILDFNHLRYVYHQGRDVKLLKNRQGNAVDGQIEEFIADVGAQVEMEMAHACLLGLPV